MFAARCLMGRFFSSRWSANGFTGESALHRNSCIGYAASHGFNRTVITTVCCVSDLTPLNPDSLE